MRLTFLLAPLCLIACTGDETIAGYGGADRTWALTELDGSPFTTRATLQFAGDGKITGDAPCNRYSGEMTTPYPWFAATQIVSTKVACPELNAETEFLGALTDMTVSEVLGDVMILSNESGREMVFKVAE